MHCLLQLASCCALTALPCNSNVFSFVKPTSVSKNWRLRLKACCMPDMPLLLLAYLSDITQLLAYLSDITQLLAYLSDITQLQASMPAAPASIMMLACSLCNT
jgi:acyl-CoA thioesterase